MQAVADEHETLFSAPTALGEGELGLVQRTPFHRATRCCPSPLAPTAMQNAAVGHETPVKAISKPGVAWIDHPVPFHASASAC
jgi:hypothetical protein